MPEPAYPKLKYQGVEIKPGQHHTENPGYIYRKVANPDEEAALEGDWHDTPRAAIDAFKGAARKPAPQPKGEAQEGNEAHARATEEWPIESEKRRRR